MALFGIPSETAKRVIEARDGKAFLTLAELQLAVPEITPFVQEVRSFLGFFS